MEEWDAVSIDSGVLQERLFSFIEEKDILIPRTVEKSLKVIWKQSWKPFVDKCRSFAKTLRQFKVKAEFLTAIAVYLNSDENQPGRLLDRAMASKDFAQIKPFEHFIILLLKALNMMETRHINRLITPTTGCLFPCHPGVQFELSSFILASRSAPSSAHTVLEFSDCDPQVIDVTDLMIDCDGTQYLLIAPGSRFIITEVLKRKTNPRVRIACQCLAPTRNPYDAVKKLKSAPLDESVEVVASPSKSRFTSPASPLKEQILKSPSEEDLSQLHDTELRQKILELEPEFAMPVHSGTRRVAEKEYLRLLGAQDHGSATASPVLKKRGTKPTKRKAEDDTDDDEVSIKRPKRNTRKARS